MPDLVKVQEAIKYHERQYLLFDYRIYNFKNSALQLAYLQWAYNYHLTQYLELLMAIEQTIIVEPPALPNVLVKEETQNSKLKTQNWLWFVIVTIGLLLMKG